MRGRQHGHLRGLAGLQQFRVAADQRRLTGPPVAAARCGDRQFGLSQFRFQGAERLDAARSAQVVPLDPILLVLEPLLTGSPNLEGRKLVVPQTRERAGYDPARLQMQASAADKGLNRADRLLDPTRPLT